MDNPNFLGKKSVSFFTHKSLIYSNFTFLGEYHSVFALLFCPTFLLRKAFLPFTSLLPSLTFAHAPTRAQALFDILLPPHRQQVSTIPMSRALQDLRLTSDNEIITASRAAFCSFLCFLREETIDDEGIYHQKAAPLGVKKPRKLGDYLLNHCHIKNSAPRAAF